MGPTWVTDGFDALVREYLEHGTIQGLRHRVFIARDETGRAIGFAEVSLREYADGCHTHPVGYLEGWFVAEPVRRTGVGRALVTACEAWARDQGCREFASDSELTNEVSLLAHEHLGFEPVDDIRCFRKDLNA
ncbi:MAG: GNAT family N-acetyltransferase [Phycisphaerales bacterium]